MQAVLGGNRKYKAICIGIIFYVDCCPVMLRYPGIASFQGLRGTGAILCLIFLALRAFCEPHRNPHKSASRQRSPQKSHGRNGTPRYACYAC
jgi:hypothetical protein